MTLLRARLPLLLSGALAACGASGLEDEGVRVRTATLPSSALAPAVGTSWFVYFADEALVGPAGTDLNGDGDAADAVAVAGRLGARTETTIGVAAQGAALVGDDVWLVVDEAADGRDWDASGTPAELVLVHWAPGGAPAFADTLDPLGGPVRVVDDRVYYASADALGAGDVTNLRVLERSSPLAPVAIASEPGQGPLAARVLGERDELIVLGLDEVRSGRDLDQDGDQTDETVLGLLDGERAASAVQVLGLALSGPQAAWNVRRESDRWLLGVLVDEAGQGANRNDPALFPFPLVPDGCPDDADQADEVLHYVRFPDFLEPGAVGNTGLVGRERVVVVEDHVATLSAEADAGCDLNGDGDTSDRVVRWARASGANGVIDAQPERDPERLVAVGAAPGGSLGLAPLFDRLVALVDEAADGRDHDGRAGDLLLVAWIDPDDDDSPGWTFAHQSPSNRSHGTGIFDRDGTSEPHASVSWLAEEERELRLPAVFLESVPGANPLVGSLNNNLGCAEVAKDDDVVDALPVWLDFESGPTLDFDGTGFAIVPAVGPVVSQGFVYFAADETADNRDLDGDGDLAERVLVRNPAISCDVEVVGVLAPIDAPPVFVSERNARGAVFLSTGVDFDGDGDGDELVLRHFAY